MVNCGSIKLREGVKELKKFLAKFMAFALATTLLCGISLLFIGCDKEPKYEIKLFDDEWNELEKNKDGKGYKWDVVEYEYDGKPKGFNAIAYRNGKEFYRMDYKTFDWENKIIQVLYSTPKMSGYYALTDAEKFPVEKGEYYLLYEFFSDPRTGPGHYFEGETFPRYGQEIEIKFKII